MPLTEFQLIERFFTRGPRRPETLLGVGDDCALLACPKGMSMAVTMDTLVEGRHFPEGTLPRAIGHKVLAVNLSDLAAMGAQPVWATLSLSLPEADEAWLSEFAAGFFALAEQYGVDLVGGDSVRGPRVITAQLHGFVPPAKALKRSGARDGDLIFVTGTLGDAGAGLALLKKELQCSNEDESYLRRRLEYPTPRIEAGLALRDVASAVIDVSDGLAADLGHVLEMSGVGARVNVDSLPLSSSLQRAGSQAEAKRLALSAGDDYELCFTVPQANFARVSNLPVVCTCIGAIESEAGLRLVDNAGNAFVLNPAGYDHFGEAQ